MKQNLCGTTAQSEVLSFSRFNNKKPKLGACIVTFNSDRVLEQCISSLRVALQPWHPAPIVIVDNHSDTPPNPPAGGALCPTVVVQNQTNRGYGAACNQGAAILLGAGCRYLLFLNPDVRLTPLTIERMMATMASRPAVGCVGGIAISPDREACCVARSRPTFLEKLVSYGALRRFCPWLVARHFLTAPQLVDGQVVYAVSGPVLLFRSEAFEAIGGFDEALFLFEEEFAIAERMLSAGWRVGFSRAEYYHEGAHSTKRQPLAARLAFVRSEAYLVKKYYRWPVALRRALLALRLAELPLVAAWRTMKSRC